MEITLEKIELVRDRTGVSYKEAKDALEAADGSIVDAIISLEENVEGVEATRSTEKAGGRKEAMMAKIKDIVAKGNVSKIIITKDDKTVLNIPLTAGLVGAVLAPWGIIAGALAAFGTKCKIEFLKDDGTTVDLSGKAGDFVENAKEKGNEVYQTVREKAPQSFDDIKAKGQEVYQSVKEKAPASLDELKTKGQEVYQSVKEKAPGSLDELKTRGQEAFEKARETASDVADKAKSKIKRGVDDIEDLDFDDIKEELGEAIDEVVEKAEEVVDEAVEEIKE